jgi:DNA sulfur modification protein DndB
MESISLNDLLAEHKSGSFLDIPGRLARTFGQTTLSTTMPMSKLQSVYEVDLEVQRALIPRNLSQLMDYVLLYLDHGQSIYFPGIILSARGSGSYDEEHEIYRLEAVDKLYVVDGQHRLAAFRRLTETLQSALARARDRREFDRVEEMTEKLGKLYNFPMSVMIYLDIDARQERQLFSDINKLPRKIGGNLAVLREQRRFYHVLATKLAEECPSLQQLGVDIYTERGKSPEYLFSYHLLIELLVGLFEGRMKSGARNNGYFFTEQEQTEHFELATHYFEHLLKYLPRPEPGKLCWSENVQIALSLFFHQEATKTGAYNRYTLEHAVKILPHIDWDSIYSGDEKDRLPRRTRIMKAYHFVRDFYDGNPMLLIGDDKEDAG